MLKEADNENFRHVIDSLKKSRADPITDPHTGDVINQLLYEDPFVDGHLLKEAKRPRTAFVEGRRGTGKSSLFQRLQHDLRRDKRVVTCYLDGQRILVNANLDHNALQNERNASFARKVALFDAFLPMFVRELKRELTKRELRANTSLFGGSKLSKQQLFERLDQLTDVTNFVRQVDISGQSTTTTLRRTEIMDEKGVQGGAAISLSGPRLTLSGGGSRATVSSEATEGTQHIMRTFKIDSFVEPLRKLLQEFGITGVYIFIDDFSEIDPHSASVLMSEIIYPLEVAADELFTFKIAVYPGEYKIEPLERSRIDILHLDPYQMYSRRTGPAMEAAAADYIGRLLTRRFDYFCGPNSIGRFFAASHSEVCTLLFDASFCNPRAIGWILAFAVEERLEKNKPLTQADLKGGARKYFERLVAPKVSDRRIFSARADERDRIFVAKALLNAFVDEAKRLKGYKDSAFFSSVQGANPTSHFYCQVDCEKHLQFLLDSQVLHFYRYAADKSGKEIGVFALDYGLCESEGVVYGRTGVGQIDKDYFVQRVFNYSDKINTLCGTLEVFCCDKCSATEGLQAESALAMIRFMCPTCRSGTMKKELRNLPDPALAKAEATPKLSSDEFNVLSMLAKSGGKRLSAKEIGPAIDISSHYVGHLARRLVEEGYVDRSRSMAGRPYQYLITTKAKQQFFAEPTQAMN